jgi:hypothetical protein
VRSLILWLLALGLGLTGYDAYRGREGRGGDPRIDRGVVVVAPSTVNQVQSSEGGNGLPPPPRR